MELALGAMPQNLMNEAPNRMTPMTLGDHVPVELADLAARLLEETATLGGQLHPVTLTSLADLVRMMNCYYSNLIEGHPTRPADVDATLRGSTPDQAAAIAADPERLRLLDLSLAHIDAQRWIDDLHLGGILLDPASTVFVCEVHRRFYSGLPPHFREIRKTPADPVQRMMEAGLMRRGGQEVGVGRHQPPSGGEPVEVFMAAYATEYSALRRPRYGRAQRLFGIAAAHHRLLHIHPFDDGNGRVARLVTHAITRTSGWPTLHGR